MFSNLLINLHVEFYCGGNPIFIALLEVFIQAFRFHKQKDDPVTCQNMLHILILGLLNFVGINFNFRGIKVVMKRN